MLRSQALTLLCRDLASKCNKRNLNMITLISPEIEKNHIPQAFLYMSSAVVQLNRNCEIIRVEKWRDSATEPDNLKVHRAISQAGVIAFIRPRQEKTLIFVRKELEILECEDENYILQTYNFDNGAKQLTKDILKVLPLGYELGIL